MSKFNDIRALWDEGVKFTFDDLSTPKMAINMIIKEIKELNKFENEKINDLYILLSDLKDINDKDINEKTSEIISKYYKTTSNFKSMSKFEQFAILKVVIQKIIYDLTERGDECEN